MKNCNKWKPSKYVFKHGKLVASKDPKEVAVGSRLIVNLIAEAYNFSIPKYAKGKLLDLGCGKVPLFHIYKDYITNNICVDWENTIHKNEYLDFECDLNEVLPFQDEEFDTIILSDVLEHISQPENLWKEMQRILSKEGKLILNVPFYYWIHEHPHDYYRYTEFALRRFVENSGLRLLYLDSVGGTLEVITDIFAKNILLVPKIGSSIAKFVQWFMLLFIKTKPGKKISKITKDNFPLGYFLIAEKP
ncbi:MAG: class I SAM-dependent methyltransferase [Ignavibacteriaceae bacterium]